MIERLEKCFATLQRPALVIFVTAGDPDAQTSFGVLEGLPDAGADIIELGMPFSDPIADGPTIQASSQRALRGGMTLSGTLSLLKKFRKKNTHTPVVLMGYANPIHSYGYEQFATDAAQAGADGVLVVDMPPEEDAVLHTALQKNFLGHIRLIAPTTPEERLPKILAGTSGFVYYVSLIGITGEGTPNVPTVQERLKNLRRRTNVPLVVGFGLKSKEQLQSLGACAEGFVVGSAVVERCPRGGSALAFVKKLAEGLQ